MVMIYLATDDPANYPLVRCRSCGWESAAGLDPYLVPKVPK